MREHILVCPFDASLLERLTHKRLVVTTTGVESIHHISRLVNDYQSQLHCIAVQHKGSLATIPFHESWRGIPLAIFVNELGTFKEVIGKLRLIRDLNVRFFFTSDNPANFTSIHILASLGIDCGISFGEKEIDWEAMNDLMTYAVYGKANRASIEPFSFATRNYHPARVTDFGSVYFENPQTYLHIDSEENIALTAKDLKEGRFISHGIESLTSIHDDEKFNEAIHAWQEFFLKADGCAYCQAWRVCLGKFAGSAEQNPGCSQFFVDMMEAADHFLSMQHKNKRKELWQP